jgi:hypothetical protein
MLPCQCEGLWNSSTFWDGISHNRDRCATGLAFDHYFGAFAHTLQHRAKILPGFRFRYMYDRVRHNWIIVPYTLHSLAQHVDHIVRGDDAGQRAILINDRQRQQVVFVE